MNGDGLLMVSPQRNEHLEKQWGGPSGHEKDSLAIYMEQGVGDEVMYSWYFDFLQKDTTDLIVECDRRLIPIFERTFPSLNFEARGIM